MIAAESTAGTVEGALDEVVRRLAREVDRYLDSLRAEDRQPEAATRRRRHRETLMPVLERMHAENRARAFFAFLEPALRSVAPHARRELRVLQTEGTVPTGQIVVADVLDEVLVRAWDRFTRRPKDLPVDLWLIQLIHDALGELAREPAHQSLGDALPMQRRRPVDIHLSEDSWTERPEYPESVELSELLPGAPGIDAWDRLDLELKQVALDRLLGELSPLERHALILNAVEGFDPAEIADFQDRPRDDVLADIEDARRVLQQRVMGDDLLSTIEREFEQQEGARKRRRPR
jgi:DNA-directed RNA polymerase specialized sigma24 family protein